MKTLEQQDIARLNFTVKNSNIVEMQNLYYNHKIIDLIESSFNKYGRLITNNNGCRLFKLNWAFTLKLDASQSEQTVLRPTHYEKSFILLLITLIKEYYAVDDYELTYDFFTQYIDNLKTNNLSNNTTVINNYYLNITNKEINIDKRQTKSVTYSDGCNYGYDRRGAYIRGMKLPKPASSGLPRLSMW